MLTAHIPHDWRDLQESVARILSESGFNCYTEKVIKTVRGKVEIDVYAQETVDGRTSTVLCECKHWSSRVPQTVVHGFRTVLADSGAHVGYLISTAGFQSGALEAGEATNLRLVTWQEFQNEFAASWIKHCLIPKLEQLFESRPGVHDGPLWHFGSMGGYVWVKKEARPAYRAWQSKHALFAQATRDFLLHLIHGDGLGRDEAIVLPLRKQLQELNVSANPDALIPEAVFDATGYLDFLDAVLRQTETVVSEFPICQDEWEIYTV